MVRRIGYLCGFFLFLLHGCGDSESTTPSRFLPLPSESECGLNQVENCGSPVQGEEGRWQWHPVEGSQCLDGSSTGFGIRLGSEPDKVLFYLEGGGACYNTWSCENIFAAKFGAAAFGEGKQTGIFNLAELKNPFRTWTHVYIPYCSGDLHSGSVPFGEGYAGQAHWGYQNISLYLERLVPSLKNAERIMLVGSSAGGFGATYNWLRIQRAFGDIPVDVIDDSGPFLTSEYLPSCFHQRISELWNQAVVFPRDCEECVHSIDSFIAHLNYTREHLPHRRYALLTEVEDLVIRAFFSFALDDCREWENERVQKYDPAEFHRGVRHYNDRVAHWDNTFIYQAEGNGHVLLFNEFSDGIHTEQNGVKLYDWINQFLSSDSLQSVTIPVPENP